ncbi:MAG TPA: hypothetical protein VFY89_04325 [Ktedonobacterales bacterium]
MRRYSGLVGLLGLLALLLTACSTDSPRASGAPTPTPSPTLKPGTPVAAPTCAPPSPITRGSLGPEVQGKVTGSGELWGQLQGSLPIPTKRDFKIVWKMTGSGDLTLRATGPGGAQLSPKEGPTLHGGSNWEKPGEEWGSIFTFPVAGCWDVHASRDDISGDVLLMVAA